MRALKWKDRIDVDGNVRCSQARAAREVHGRYRIIFNPGGYELALGGFAKPFYEVEFRRSHRRDWDCISMSDTLAKAKQAAQDDHDERQADAAIEFVA
jgi:hypothetical protein